MKDIPETKFEIAVVLDPEKNHHLVAIKRRVNFASGRKDHLLAKSREKKEEFAAANLVQQYNKWNLVLELDQVFLSAHNQNQEGVLRIVE